MGATSETMLLAALSTGHQNRAYFCYETRNWRPISQTSPARLPDSNHAAGKMLP
jgi:hypothetical protein